MHSLSKSSKGQFFILSAVVIISAVFLISGLFEPSKIIDTSSVVLDEAPFIFENIKEKATATISGSKTCDDARFNLEEYKKFVEIYSLSKGYFLFFNYTATPCFISEDYPFPVFFAKITQTLKIADIFLEANYTLSWPSS